MIEYTTREVRPFENELLVKFPYSMKDMFKKDFVNARWSKSESVWIIPEQYEEKLRRLCEDILADEILEYRKLESAKNREKRDAIEVCEATPFSDEHLDEYKRLAKEELADFK